MKSQNNKRETLLWGAQAHRKIRAFLELLNPVMIMVLLSPALAISQTSLVVEGYAGKDDSTVVSVAIQSQSGEKPILGVYLDDLTFEDAYKMHYDYTYGVIIDDVTSHGAAAKAGLMEDDIIMEFDGVKVNHEDHLLRLIQSKRVSDIVEIKYFRDGEVRNTTVKLQSRNGSEEKSEGRRSWLEGHDTGDGGLTFYTSWFEPDHAPVSQLLTNLGFNDVISDPPVEGSLQPGYWFQGVRLQFEGDDGWFWGFDFADFESSKRIKSPSGGGIRKYDYEFSYWGFLFDKRISFFRPLILSGGLTAGTGKYQIQVLETNENYNWSNFNQQMLSGENNFVELKKGYILAEPHVSFIARFTDWIGVEARLGYLYGYSYHTGWNANVIGENYEVKNSPDTQLSAPTYSVGLWFDFF